MLGYLIKTIWDQSWFSSVETNEAPKLIVWRWKISWCCIYQFFSTYRERQSLCSVKDFYFHEFSGVNDIFNLENSKKSQETMLRSSDLGVTQECLVKKLRCAEKDGVLSWCSYKVPVAHRFELWHRTASQKHLRTSGLWFLLVNSFSMNLVNTLCNTKSLLKMNYTIPLSTWFASSQSYNCPAWPKFTLSQWLCQLIEGLPNHESLSINIFERLYYLLYVIPWSCRQKTAEPSKCFLLGYYHTIC